jgi:soluble lytic murein transglycosylase
MAPRRTMPTALQTRDAARLPATVSITMLSHPFHVAAALMLALGLSSTACSQGSPRAETPESANTSAEPTEVLGSVGAVTQTTDLALDARDALRRRDGTSLAALRDISASQRNPLAQWIDYWELGNRLNTAQQSDLEAFYARWPGTYVEDRLRNDWLIELGVRRDWTNFARDFARFRMNDDREVTCYALLVEHQVAHTPGKTVPAAFKARAIEAWNAQRDLDEGCNLLASTLYEAKVFTQDDLWQRARLAAEVNKPRLVRAIAALAAPTLQSQVANAIDKPALYLNAGATTASRTQSEITTLALIRVAANEPDIAATCR